MTRDWSDLAATALLVLIAAAALLAGAWAIGTVIGMFTGSVQRALSG